MAEQITIDTYEFPDRPAIKGYPELRWTGKRPFKSTQYFPAQLRERYGEEKNGWINKIFWGDNLQVMSHLLKNYRGAMDLVYIDPPFDSKADYKKQVKLKGQIVANDSSSFEEKQYGDIWTNDEYLQFIYERLTLICELLSDRGSIYLHCDWHKSHHLRMIMDEVLGPNCFRNEVIWCYQGTGKTLKQYKRKHDTLLFYTKSNEWNFNAREVGTPFGEKQKSKFSGHDEKGYYKEYTHADGQTYRKYLEEDDFLPLNDWWSDVYVIQDHSQRLGYPTQKPEALLERIIKASSNPGDLVFDCFMGSGTTQAVAMKLGRRFIGADINLGAIQTTTKRLLNVAEELGTTIDGTMDKYTGFEVYNVNNYDFFRNPIEAKELIISALEIQKFDAGSVYDGELDGRMVKILPVNRIATKADLEELKANLPYKTFERRKAEDPNTPVERLTLVCMGHEPDLKASLIQELSEYKLDVEIVDILRDKSILQLKREAEADVVIEDGKLRIKAFYPMNLMQKLSLQKEYVENWKQLVESVMIDWNYDGAVMTPTVTDIPTKDEFVAGEYIVPKDAGVIKVKITDLLSESLEVEVR